MGRIPTITSSVDPRSGRISGSLGGPMASPEAFGAGIARGISGVAGGLDEVAGALYADNQRRQQEELANRVAQADFTPRELELRNEVGPDAQGYRERAMEDYDAWVDEQANAIEDNATRQAFRERMAQQKVALSSRAAQYEFGTRATNSENEANASLMALGNQLRTTPDQYDEFVAQGADVIAARPGLSQTAKAAMQRSWREQAASARFDGMMERASTPADLDAIQEELTSSDRDWTAEMSRPVYDRKLDDLRTMRTTMNTKADADARAALDTLDSRASDPMVTLDDAELSAVGQLVQNSSNPVTAARYARILTDNDIKKQARTLTPTQQRRELQRTQNNRLPVRVNEAVNRAATEYGISTSYLAGAVSREYGMYLKGPEDQIDYSRGNAAGASGAVGIGQIIPGTAKMVFRSPEFQAVWGSTKGLSDAQILEMRSDPDASILATAVLAKQTDRLVRAVTGRPATDAELYMGHFLGAGGAAELMRKLQSDPDASSVDLFPQAAAANKTVFYNKDGSAKTAQELYNELGRTFGTNPTYMSYGNQQTREKVLKETETRIADDPMAFANSVGNSTLSDVFAEGGMAARAQEAIAVATMYSQPQDTFKPFTKDEAQQLKTNLANANADEAVQIVASVQQMGSMAKAAMAQIGQDGNTYAYAGGLGLETGNMSAASDIIRGQKRIDENPAIKTDMGASREDVNAAFNTATGAALYDLAPSARQAILDAATAHYIETNTARGKAWDAEAFGASVQAVMGGGQGQAALEDVNGAKVVLPPGVDGDTMETAFQKMTEADWAALGDQGLPPRYASGAIADPEDLANEAVLRAIGGGKYRVATADGNYLVTGRVTNAGQAEYYIMSPDADRVHSIASRTAQGPQQPVRAPSESGAGTPQQGAGFDLDMQRDFFAAQSDGDLSDDDIQALVNKYGKAAVEGMMQ